MIKDLEKMKIKYRIEQWGRTVVFQVLEMDKRFRSDGEERIFEAKNGIEIASINVPYLYEFKIYLFGARKKDDDYVGKLYFDTEKEAKEYIVKVHEALADWAENWEGWKNEVIKKYEEGVFVL